MGEVPFSVGPPTVGGDQRGSLGRGPTSPSTENFKLNRNFVSYFLLLRDSQKTRGLGVGAEAPHTDNPPPPPCPSKLPIRNREKNGTPGTALLGRPRTDRRRREGWGVGGGGPRAVGPGFRDSGSPENLLASPPAGEGRE